MIVTHDPGPWFEEVLEKYFPEQITRRRTGPGKYYT